MKLYLWFFSTTVVVMVTTITMTTAPVVPDHYGVENDYAGEVLTLTFHILKYFFHFEPFKKIIFQ